MWKCPICSGHEKLDHICSNCGFDECTDFVSCRTVCPVSAQDIKIRKAQKAAVGREKRIDGCKQMENEEVFHNQKETEEAARKKTEDGQRIKQYGKIKKVSLIILVCGILMAVLFFMLNTINNRGEAGWKQLEPYFKEAIDNNALNYDTALLEDMANDLKSKGYTDIETGESLPSGDNDYIASSLRATMWSPEEIGYYVDCIDCYKEGSVDWYSRTIIFSDTWVSVIRNGEYKDENNYRLLHNENVPLPLEIELGDSFEKVCEKLGVTEDMKNYAQHRSGGLYVVLNDPNTYGAGGTRISGEIYISFDGYSYRFGFNGDGNVLNTYTVGIDR